MKWNQKGNSYDLNDTGETLTLFKLMDSIGNVNHAVI